MKTTRSSCVHLRREERAARRACEAYLPVAPARPAPAQRSAMQAEPVAAHNGAPPCATGLETCPFGTIRPGISRTFPSLSRTGAAGNFAQEADFATTCQISALNPTLPSCRGTANVWFWDRRPKTCQNQRKFCQGFVAHDFSTILETATALTKTTDLGEKLDLLHLVFGRGAPS